MKTFHIYGEYISNCMKNNFIVAGMNDPETGKILFRRVIAKRWDEQAQKKPGTITLFRDATPCDVHICFFCTCVDQGKISIPEGVEEGVFLTQISQELIAADASGTLDQYMDSYIKMHVSNAKEK